MQLKGNSIDLGCWVQETEWKLMFETLEIRVPYQNDDLFGGYE